MSDLIIAPSILSANFANLGAEIAAIDRAGADWIHIDVMDGHFVPALTFGPSVIAAIRAYTKKPFDVHLMISNPDAYLEAYAKSGADGITVHAEACVHLDRTLHTIRSLGKKVGVALNPSTPPEMLNYVIDKVDLILVMTVNPGYSGQSYLPSQEAKLKIIREMIGNRSIQLQVDGGITDMTIAGAMAAGAKNIVSGSYVFLGDYAKRIQNLRKLGRAIKT